MKTSKPLNSTNAMVKKRKKPKNFHKKDEENILSKDIDVEEEMKQLERMGERRFIKPREDLTPTYTVKNLKFKPQKYKGNYLPYHLRWIFSNNIKSNEIVLLHEIEALENEINRLKKMKFLNRESRRVGGLPVGLCTNPCPCCKKLEQKKHECTHEFCDPNCPKKKMEEQQQMKESNMLFNMNTSSNSNIMLGKKRLLPIFGTVDHSKDKKNLFIVKN